MHDFAYYYDEISTDFLEEIRCFTRNAPDESSQFESVEISEKPRPSVVNIITVWWHLKTSTQNLNRGL